MRGYNICIKPGGTAGFSLLSQQRLLRQEFFCSEEGKQAAAQQTFVFTRTNMSRRSSHEVTTQRSGGRMRMQSRGRKTSFRAKASFARKQTFVFTRHLNHLNSDEAKRRKKT